VLTMKANFEISDILPISLTLVVIGIGVGYGLSVMEDVQSDMITDVAGCNSTSVAGCGDAYNATTSAIEGVAVIPDKLPMIALVVVAAIIIGILVRYLMVRYN